MQEGFYGNEAATTDERCRHRTCADELVELRSAYTRGSTCFGNGAA